MAELNLGKIRFTFKGTYSGGYNYEKDDVVYHDGSTWLMIAAGAQNVEPTPANNAYWSKMSQGSDLGAIQGLAAGDLVYFDGANFTRLPAAASSHTLLRYDANSSAPVWGFSEAILQSRCYMDRASTTTAATPYYFNGSEFSNTITPKKADSIIRVDITLFGEANTHDTAFYMQYSINQGTWTNCRLGQYGQAGSFKVGSYPDSDYNSTPHTYNYHYADTFNTTDPIAFRLFQYNGGTFYHNRSVATQYESGTSGITLSELNADICTIEWRQ